MSSNFNKYLYQFINRRKSFFVVLNTRSRSFLYFSLFTEPIFFSWSESHASKITDGTPGVDYTRSNYSIAPRILLTVQSQCSQFTYKRLLAFIDARVDSYTVCDPQISTNMNPINTCICVWNEEYFLKKWRAISYCQNHLSLKRFT